MSIWKIKMAAKSADIISKAAAFIGMPIDNLVDGLDEGRLGRILLTALLTAKNPSDMSNDNANLYKAMRDAGIIR